MGDLVQGAFPSVASSELLSSACVAPWDARQRLWWLLWSLCPGIGVRRLRRLVLLPGGLEAAWFLPVERLADQMGWPRSLGPTVDQFRCRWGSDPLPRLAEAARAGRRVLLPGDRRWPEAMDALDRPPPALYWQGRGSLWAPLAHRQAVAVVGTRRPSSHGLLMANRIGAALAAAGWPVVSGLAEGIDGAAHEGCLAAGGAPVGVLGTPLDRTYPRHHSALQQLVARQGLLLSEWPVGAPVRPGHFASRNRLQVALATALVLVECPLASGALHSADLAWAQGLPLWVVPADAARLSALGSNRLLARGATPLLTTADLIDQLGPGPLAGGSRAAAATAVGEISVGAMTVADTAPEARAPAARSQALHSLLSAGAWARQGRPEACRFNSAGRRLLAAVGTGASLEQISQALGQSAEELAPVLLDLELAGLLKAEPGLRWRPAAVLVPQGSA